VSNGPWGGPDGKWAALDAHDVLFLNNDLRKRAPDAWTHEHIKARTDEMIEAILEIWPTPSGHQVGHASERRLAIRQIDLADLLNAGVLQAGATLYSGNRKHVSRTATLLPDGYIEVDGKAYQYPATAASVIAGRRVNGWGFFRVGGSTGPSLREILDDYRTKMAIDVDAAGESSEDGEGEDDLERVLA
jgi:hypothetical protein